MGLNFKSSSCLSAAFKLNHLRNVNHINVNGNDIPDPIESFEQLRPVTPESPDAKNSLAQDYTQLIPKKIFENLLGYKFEKPSPVQMQAIPVLLNVNRTSGSFYIESEGSVISVHLIAESRGNGVRANRQR